MNTREFLTGVLLHGLLPISIFIAPAAFGEGIVRNPTHEELAVALSGGGNVSFEVSGTIVLTNTLIITEDTTLDANGQAVILSGAGTVRLFQVNNGTAFSIKGLSLADGWSAGANGSDVHPVADGEDGYGGGILNLGGNLVMENCVLSNHIAQGGNAGRDLVDANANIGRGGRGYGGAICGLGGTISLTNCLLIGNRAIGGKGSAAASIGYSLVGDSGPGWGGAIYVEGGRLNLHAVTANTNVSVGGEAERSSFPGLLGHGGEAMGGAIFLTNSVAYLGNSIFGSNSASGGSNPLSGLENGPGAGAAHGGAVFLARDAIGTVRLATFTNNSAFGGRGIRYYRGGVGQGGAMCNWGMLKVLDSTFSRNKDSGGSCRDPGRAQGGAIYSTNRLAVIGSTFDQNLAQGGEGEINTLSFPGAAGEGGAIWSMGELAITNSTYASNRAAGGLGVPPGDARGGAIHIAEGSAVLVCVTIAWNEAIGGAGRESDSHGTEQGGGLSKTNSTAATYQSIIANNLTGGDVYGGIIDGGYNFCSDGTAEFSAPGSVNSGNPMLSVLSKNGGSTATIGLLAGSPARDAVPVSFVFVDQRGVSRPLGRASDIGAFEADYLPAAPRLAITRLAGNLIITFTAEAGFTYVLRSSTDLDEWLEVDAKSAADAGPEQFIRPIADAPQSFFRVDVR